VIRKELTPEEKLQEIINQIIEERSDYISVNKLMDIIGIEPTPQKNVRNPYMSNTLNKKSHNCNEYKENYIS
jgi:hypothetical protein